MILFLSRKPVMSYVSCHVSWLVASGVENIYSMSLTQTKYALSEVRTDPPIRSWLLTYKVMKPEFNHDIQANFLEADQKW